MDPLLSEFAAALIEGQQRLADAMRRFVVTARPDLAARLPFGEDAVFLDPLLFSYFTATNPAASLDQLLWARIAPDARPDHIPIRTCPEGTAELPGIGVLRTNRAGAEVTLGQRGDLYDDAGPLAYVLDSERCVPGTGVVLDGRISPLVGSLFARDGVAVPVRADIAPTRVRDLAKAFRLLAELYPDYDAVVRATTRRVVLFTSEESNSFAAVRAHGCVFLNTAYGRGPVFHFEDLLHQCGHVAFAAMTLDPSRVLTVPAGTLLGGEVDASGEPRTAYVVLHAVVTERFMAEGLLRAVAAGAVRGEQWQEARGRLSYILARYVADLTSLSAARVLATDGSTLGTQLAADLRRLLAAARPYVAGLDLSGQPYNFSYSAFRAKNLKSDGRARSTFASCG